MRIILGWTVGLVALPYLAVQTAIARHLGGPQAKVRLAQLARVAYALGLSDVKERA